MPVKCGGACKEPKIRLAWGCDDDTEVPGYWIDCWICGGKPRECLVCKGAGKIPMHRCPGRCHTHIISQVIEYYGWMKKGFLPSSGAMLDQSNTFITAVGFVGSLVAHHEEKERLKQKAALPKDKM